MDETIPPGVDITLDTLGPIGAPGAQPPVSWRGAIVGIALTFGLHLGLVALLAGLHAIPHESAADLLQERLEETQEPRVLVTKLVKLGRALDKRRLPDRIRRQVRALAPDERVGTPTDVAIARSGKAPDEEHQKAPEKQVTPDDLAKTLERAKILAQVGDTRSTEGSPEGVADGEIGPDEARPLDLYVTLLTRLMRQRWTAPPIPADQLSGLRCAVTVQVQADLTVGAVRISRSSGNQMFDDSAIEAIRRFDREVGRFPPPPDEQVAAEIVGRSITVRFTP